MSVQPAHREAILRRPMARNRQKSTNRRKPGGMGNRNRRARVLTRTRPKHQRHRMAHSRTRRKRPTSRNRRPNAASPTEQRRRRNPFEVVDSGTGGLYAALYLVDPYSARWNNCIFSFFIPKAP